MNKPVSSRKLSATLAGPFLALLLLGVSPALHAQAADNRPQTVESGDNVSLNFNNAEIEAVVRAIGKLSNRNFIIDPRVKGTINIVTHQPVPRAMTYSILLSALRLQGYAVVESKDVVKVVPEADAKLHAVQVDKDRSKPATGDRIVTEVFAIKHESANQLVQVIRPLVTANNTVSVYPGNNSLVITDYAENIARIARIIQSIDVPQGDAQVLELKHTSAVDMAALLTRLYNEGAQNQEATMRVTVLADSRSNSLVVRSENRSRLQAVRSMVAQLDQPNAITNVRVVYLKNADATRVAQTLRSVLARDASGNAATPAAQPASTTAPTSTQSTSSMSSNTASGAAQSAINLGGGSVYADTANNALVITAPDAMYNNLRAVIDQLDRRPAQVFIEALIAEMSSERAAEYGIQWTIGAGNSNGGAVANTNFGGTGQNLIGIAQNPASIGKGMNFIVGGGSVEIGGVRLPELGMLARFLESDAKANILSTPSLVTVDNEEAKIVIGKNVPFVTGQYTNTGSSTPSNPFQTIERKDVGLTLKVKPQITEGGTVRLQIMQEVSDVLQDTASNANGPTTTKRSLESVVIANNGEVIVLGGLVQDNYTGGVDKVPLLGDLPVLGPLFRYDTRSRSKSNLLIFLRPRIMRSSEESRSVTQNRYDYIMGEQRGNVDDKNLMRGEAPPPVAPPIEQFSPQPVAPTAAKPTPAQ